MHVYCMAGMTEREQEYSVLVEFSWYGLVWSNVDKLINHKNVNCIQIPRVTTQYNQHIKVTNICIYLYIKIDYSIRTTLRT